MHVNIIYNIFNNTVKACHSEAYTDKKASYILSKLCKWPIGTLVQYYTLIIGTVIENKIDTR